MRRSAGAIVSSLTVTGGGSSFSTAFIVSTALSPLNGRVPLSIS